MNTSKLRFPPRMAIAVCALLWSTSGLFVKIVSWNAFVIAGSRSAVAFLFLLAYRRLTLRHGEPFLSGIKTLPAWLAGFAYSGTMVLFVVANKLTASANVIVLQYSAPIWAALFGAVLIREKPKPEHWISLALIFAGLYILLKDGFAAGGLLGDILAICSGVLFGMTSVFMRMQKDAAPLDGMILSHFITVIVCAAFFAFYPPELTRSNILSILFMGVIQIGCAAVFYSYGIKRVSAISAMLISAIEPLFNPLWVFIVVGEAPVKTTFIGGSIILTAVLFSNIAGWKRERGCA